MNYNYKEPEKESDGMYSYVTNENNENIVFESPYLTIIKEPYLYKNKYYIDLSIPQEEKEFFKKIVNYEEEMIETIYNNSKKWFGKRYPIDILDDYHLPLIKVNKQGIPKIKLLLDDEIIENNNLTIDTKKIFNIHFIGIKFLRQNFSLIWKIKNFKNEDEEVMFFNDENSEDIMKSFVSDFEEEVDYESDYENQMKTLDELRNTKKLDKNKKSNNEFNVSKTDLQILTDEDNNIEIDGDEEIMEEIINNNEELEETENNLEETKNNLEETENNLEENENNLEETENNLEETENNLEENKNNLEENKNNLELENSIKLKLNKEHKNKKSKKKSSKKKTLKKRIILNW